MRAAHPVQMDAQQVRLEKEPKWTTEEKMRLACLEIELEESEANWRLINKALAGRCTGWCRDVPGTYHQAKTVMIPKISGADRPEDFRPITVSPVLVRHYIRCCRTARVDINPAQRAFVKTDGCADNTVLVDAII